MSRRGPRARRFVVLAVVMAGLAGLVYVLHAPLLTQVGHLLVHRDPPMPSDAILVLAGGVFDREMEAAELFAAGLAPRVLMTEEPEPKVLAELRARGVRVENSLALRRRVLIELGVPAEHITVLPGIVAATVHEAEAARRWVDATGADSLMVVTSSFHTARARFVFRRVFDEAPVALRFVPAGKSDFQPDSWWLNRTTLRDGVFELQRTMFYWIRY